MTKKKKLKIFIAVICLLAIVTGIGSFISYSKFEVVNPFSTAKGLFQVIFTEKEYVVIQKYPKVIVAKPNASLIDYMVSQGFKEDKENQLGALHRFTNDVAVQYVVYTTNKYFAKWRWQE